MKRRKNISKLFIQGAFFCCCVPALTALTISCGQKATSISSIIGIRDLGEIENTTISVIQSRIEELNEKAINLRWSEIEIHVINSTSAYISATHESSSYKGYVKVTFTIAPPVLLDISSVITIVDLGEITSQTSSAIQTKIIVMNSAAESLQWDQINITGVTSTSAHVVAIPGSTLYTGQVDVVFTIPPVTINISSIITTVNLQEITEATIPVIQSKIIALNSGASSLQWDQIDINGITSTGAHVAAKSASTLYTGSVDVVFTVAPVKINISSIITTVNLQEITEATIPVIQSKIIALNSGASSLQWDQIDINGITSTGAHVAAKSASTLYTGSVDVVFTVAPVLVNISSIITVVDLNEIASATEQEIKSKIIAYNSGAAALVWDDIVFSEIGSTSAHLAAKSASTLYTGYVDVIFTLPAVIGYNADGTNWDGYISGFLTCTLNGADNTCSISSNTGYTANDLIIPNTIVVSGTTYTVKTISQGAFDGSTTLTGNLTIPNTMTSIGNSAFRDCTELNGQLSLPNSLTSIGDSAFQYCAFIGELTLPNTLTTISARAFEECQFTGTLTIPDTVTTIGNYAFGQCSGFTGDLVIPNYVTTIGNYAFNECTGFNNDLIIPAAATSIGTGTFYGCTGITDIVCSYSSQPSVGYHSFFDMSSTGTVLNTNASYSSSDLCDYLKLAGNLPSGWNPFIEYNADGTNWDGYISGSLTCTLNQANNTCSISSNTGYTANDLVIPNTIVVSGTTYTITSISQSAFYQSQTLSGSLTFPNTLVSIGETAFEECENLTGTLQLPNSITTIGNGAFRFCEFTGPLTLPNGLTSIPNWVFEGSHFVGTLTIPSTVTSIGTYAFSGNNELTGDLTIPNSVTAIGSYAFDECSGFTGTLTIPSTVTTILNGTFFACSGFTHIVCSYAAQPTVGMNAFRDMNSNGTVQNMNGAYSSANLCAYLKSAGTLPDGWTSM